MNILFVPVFLVIVALGVWVYALHKRKVSLQQKLSVVESALSETKAMAGEMQVRLEKVEQLQREELNQDQIDYRDKVQAQYAVLFQKMRDDFKDELKAVKADSAKTVKDAKQDFDKKLKDEFEKACEQIAFSEIEYKKSITQKRKQYARKNAKNAKPQRIWRYIDEE